MVLAKILVRLALFLGVLWYALWLANEHVPFAGTRNLAYTFGELNGSVTPLRPLTRVEGELRDISPGPQNIREDPVYFDIRTRIPYDTAILEIEYQKETSRPMALGIKKGSSTSWKYEIKQFEQVREESGWQRGSVSFALSDVPLDQGKYGFIISIPGLTVAEREEYIRVKRLWVTLIRAPLTFDSLLSLTKL